MPADGFYEWTRPAAGDAKVPHYFRPPGGGPFAFAGLWERWEKGAEPLETFTLLTRPPYPAVAPVHDRSPLILPRELHDAWLGADGAGEAADILAAAGDVELEGHAVSTAVNSPRRDDAGLVEPA